MASWNAKEIVKAAKRDFESAWKGTGELVSKGRGVIGRVRMEGRGGIVFSTVERLRKAYLDMGFEEVINPVFLEDTEVRKQFGPEALAVLDRCYYVGGLPRPDIGISEATLERLRALGLKAEKRSLQEVLRRYKTGELSGDDLVYELAHAMDAEHEKALEAIDKVFPEFKELRPLPSNITLRSHMTSGWFLTLEALYGKREPPIALFSIDRCFRREQREDPGHLRSYHSASSVLLDREVSLDDGKEMTRSLLSGFGFTEFKFRPDRKMSKYYSPGTQTEVFARRDEGEWVEIATFGLYSPVALSRYGIEEPVLNLGLGVERLAMALSGARDIRELVYPQFYAELELSDQEIAGKVFIDKAPSTPEGREIAERIVEVALRHGSEPSPCSFQVYDGELLGRKVRVRLVEVESGTRLLGPAALNKVVVHNGGIYGVSQAKGPAEAVERGVDTGITYIRAFANLAAWEIEKAAREGAAKCRTQVKGVKLPSEINIRVSDSAMRFITSRNKRIDIRGPVFTTVVADFG